MSTLLWLILSTTAPATDIVVELRAEHPELFTAPVLPPWPDGLPASVSNARCFDGDRELGPGDWIPRETGRVIHERLLMLEVYPARSQAVIDAIVPRVFEAVIDRVAAEPPPGYQLSTVITWAVIGVMAGATAASVVIVAAK